MQLNDDVVRSFEPAKIYKVPPVTVVATGSALLQHRVQTFGRMQQLTPKVIWQSRMQCRH